MKRLISILTVFVTCLCLMPTVNNTNVYAEINSNSSQYFITPSTRDARNKQGKYFILNKDGSYGGSYNEIEYGTGAPLNGEYDVENSEYFIADDYYNKTSTEERTIIPKFSPYQQTMEDSSGIASVLMVLNYMGYDVKGEYSEVNLVKKYEQVNKTTVYGNGTNPQGLKNLVDSLNLGWEASISGLSVSSIVDAISAIENCIKDGKFVLVRWQAPKDFGWKVIIGYDRMGMVLDNVTKQMYETVNDDMLIFAEPNDCSDHYQDGYATARMKEFHMWWCNMAVNGNLTNYYNYVVIDPKIDIDFNRQQKDLTVTQQIPEIHLPLNPDGSYQGMRNKELYGEVKAKNGSTNHLEANYNKYADYYNMKSEGSRLILEKYTVLQQTMLSSCGICAIGAAIKYLNKEETATHYDLELKLVNTIESFCGYIIKTSGIRTMDDTALLCKELGYNAYIGYSKTGITPRFSSYNQYIEMIKYHLSNGRPIISTSNAGSAHFITVIGYDDMGTDYIYDDIILTADSADSKDHFQDGYNVYPATGFYRHDTSGSINVLQQYLVIYGK